jgi:hypothetical protein
MKSWNGLGAGTPLIAPVRAERHADGLRIRALVATFATCAVIFGLNAVFPDTKNGLPLDWSRNGRPIPSTIATPFEWSEVCLDGYLTLALCRWDAPNREACEVVQRTIDQLEVLSKKPRRRGLISDTFLAAIDV